ncbi:complement component C8 gamma chain isoform X2 [Alosa alosa]|uniref:complement component C8 gamma chain isoform X2 n=1 Tax=Alosa alosa TaxID=278164 RepID=UPI002015318C|nr:complement component C8 gamma chain isoform X2 [Alosa alosa]
MQHVWICIAMLTVLGEPNTLGASRTQGRRTERNQTENTIDKITVAPNLDLDQVAGKWYLISAASKCPFLLENGFKVESTTISLTPPTTFDAPMLVSTFRKLNQQCWEIRQEYQTTKSKGRLLLSNHSSYAILYYQRQGKISMKLYGRSPKVPDSTADKFEELAAKQSLGLDYVFQFPGYSFCETADEDYVLVM